MSEQRKGILGLKAGSKITVPVHWAGKSLSGEVLSVDDQGFWFAAAGDVFFMDTNATWEPIVDEDTERDLWYEVYDIVDRTWSTHLPKEDRRTHAILTLLTEAAEVADCVKKGKYSPRHNGVLDKAHITEEIGDVMYGIVVVCIEFGIDPGDAVNILREKLAKRYA